MSIWIGAILAVATAAISQWLIWLRDQARRRADQQQELLNHRREALGKLRGLATFYCDLVLLRYETAANAYEYDASLSFRSGDPNRYSAMEQESSLEISRERELSLEQARCLKEIHYTVGFIRTLYPKDSQMDDLMRPIHEFRIRLKKDPLTYNITRENLDTYWQTVVTKISPAIDEEYRKPLLRLIDHLQQSVSVAA